MKYTLQVRGKAYPGIKHLAIAKGLGSQGVAASLCAKQLDDPTRPDYGYRPSIRAIADRVAQTLRGRCFPRLLPRDAAGQVACSVLEARAADSCTCDPARGRTPVSSEHECWVQAIQASPSVPTTGLCVCELAEARGTDLESCRVDLQPHGDGWCYIDPASSPGDSAALVAGCRENDRRVLRFIGQGAPDPGATVFVACP
jgi:hypothetical protein